MEKSTTDFDKEYTIYCDESDKTGKFYSNFYGGLIVGSSKTERVSERLNEKKKSLNFFGEVKWEKITERYQDKYIALVEAFFQEISAGNVRVRIMFRQNAHVPSSLSKKHHENQYYLLYYQFIKNAFGLEYLKNNCSKDKVKCRVYVDQIGDTNERINQFRGYIHALPNYKRFSSSRFYFPLEDIVEIRSHDHVLLQCLDIVLGAMSFRLNDKHKEKLPGKHVRGKRTRAKETVYKAILKEIRKIHKNFNIGISTAIMNTYEGRWLTHYAHWSFKARDSEYQGGLTKRGGKK